MKFIWFESCYNYTIAVNPALVVYVHQNNPTAPIVITFTGDDYTEVKGILEEVVAKLEECPKCINRPNEAITIEADRPNQPPAIGLEDQDEDSVSCDAQELDEGVNGGSEATFVRRDCLGPQLDITKSALENEVKQNLLWQKQLQDEKAEKLMWYEKAAELAQDVLALESDLHQERCAHEKNQEALAQAQKERDLLKSLFDGCPYCLFAGVPYAIDLSCHHTDGSVKICGDCALEVAAREDSNKNDTI